MKLQRYYDAKLKKRFWKFDMTIDGHRIRESGFATRDDAEQVIEALKQAKRMRRYGLTQAAPREITLKEFCDARAKDPGKINPNATKRMLARLLSVCPSGMLLTDLKKHHLRTLAEHLQATELKTNTRNQYLSCVTAALNAAEVYFPELEGWTPPKVPTAGAKENRERLLSREELGRLFTVLNADPLSQQLADTLRLMLLTGARRKELKPLSAESVNHDWSTVQFRKTKNKSNRVMAVSEMARSILSRYDKPLLAEVSEWKFYEMVAEASKAAGLPYGDRVEGGWVPHDLRHTAATVLESLGVRYTVVSALLGHKRRDQTATYTHASLEDLRQAAAVLDAWCREIDGFVMGYGELRDAMLVERI